MAIRSRRGGGAAAPDPPPKIEQRAHCRPLEHGGSVPQRWINILILPSEKETKNQTSDWEQEPREFDAAVWFIGRDPKSYRTDTDDYADTRPEPRMPRFRA